VIPPLSGQFDFDAKRRQILQSLQDGALTALRNLGAVKMTSGVTKPVSAPASGFSLLDSLNTEISNGYTAEGPRWLDRHATDNAAFTYRNQRFDYFASMFGVNTRTVDAATGKRVTNGK
jgi:hypothetical protein